MTITVAVFGGLGNQMFQYAFARAVSELHHEEFVLDSRFLRRPNQRPYALNGLSIRGTDREDDNLPPMPGRWERRFRWATTRDRVRYLFEKRFAFDPAMLDV